MNSNNVSDPKPLKGNKMGSERQKGTRRFLGGGRKLVLFCFILVRHRILTSTWISKLLPSFGEISTFSKVSSI